MCLGQNNNTMQQSFSITTVSSNSVWDDRDQTNPAASGNCYKQLVTIVIICVGTEMSVQCRSRSNFSSRSEPVDQCSR